MLGFEHTSDSRIPTLPFHHNLGWLHYPCTFTKVEPTQRSSFERGEKNQELCFRHEMPVGHSSGDITQGDSSGDITQGAEYVSLKFKE